MTDVEVENPLDLLAGLRDGAWLDEQVFPPLRYAIHGVIAEGFTLFVGPPKIGKSWFQLGAAMGIALGGCVLGSLQVAQRPVLYLALEDGHRRLQDRCRQVLEGAPIPAAFEYLTSVEPGTAVATVRAWLALHEGEEPVVFLDTLGKVMPPALMGESSYQRDYRVGATLKRTVDEHPGSALVVVHHDRKAASEDFVDAVSGTHGLAGAADSIVVLHRARQEADGVLKVTGRDVPEGEYAIRFDEGRWLLQGRTLQEAAAALAARQAAEGLDERSTRLLEVVSLHPGGITPAEAAEATGLDAKTVSTYLSRLADSGRILRPSRGRYTPTPVGSVGTVGNAGPSHAAPNTPNTPNTPLGDGSDGTDRFDTSAYEDAFPEAFDAN